MTFNNYTIKWNFFTRFYNNCISYFYLVRINLFNSSIFL